MDQATGHEVWKYAIPVEGAKPAFHSQLLLAGDRIVVATDGGGASVFSFDQKSGKVHWRHRIEMDAADSSAEDKGARTGITRSDATIHFATYSGRLIALDFETGEKQWDFASTEFKGAEFGAFQQAVIGDHVFYGTPKTLYAFESTTGKVVWERPLTAPISTGIIAEDGRLYFGTADHQMVGVDPTNGEIVGTIATQFQPGFFLPVVVENTLIVPSKGSSVLEAFDLGLRKELWSLPAQEEWGSPLMASWKGTLIAGDAQGRVLAIRPDRGSIIWTEPVGGTVRGVQVSGDTIYAGNTSGDLVAFPARPDTVRTTRRP